MSNKDLPAVNILTWCIRVRPGPGHFSSSAPGSIAPPSHHHGRGKYRSELQKCNLITSLMNMSAHTRPGSHTELPIGYKGSQRASDWSKYLCQPMRSGGQEAGVDLVRHRVSRYVTLLRVSDWSISLMTGLWLAGSDQSAATISNPRVTPVWSSVTRPLTPLYSF